MKQKGEKTLTMPQEIDSNWSGSYFSNDGQIIIKEDAKNLSIAFSRMADISNDIKYTKFYRKAADFFSQGPISIW